MTFEQLVIFVAVAEREHLTRAAEAVGRTPSAVSAAVKALEGHYGVALFHRVGRRIELTDAGRLFLVEARATLARARSAELVLSELGGLQRGELTVHASQTIASYWLPPKLMHFHELYPGIDLKLSVGNTRSVADAVLAGVAEVGLVEGAVADGALAVRPVDHDALIVVVSRVHPWSSGKALAPYDLVEGTAWVMREEGSGTRTEFEAALARAGVNPQNLRVALEFPSNEAVLSAVLAGQCAAAVSGAAAGLYLKEGILVRAAVDLGTRAFSFLVHKERHQSKASAALERLCRSPSYA